ncbi:replication initiator, partial [Streptomyces sp. NPDC005071]
TAAPSTEATPATSPASNSPSPPDDQKLTTRIHFSTKTRRYSTTLGALRTARAEWRRLQAAIAHGDENPVPADPDSDDTTLVLAHWTFAGTGLTRGEEWLAASITPDSTEGEQSHA